MNMRINKTKIKVKDVFIVTFFIFFSLTIGNCNGCEPSPDHANTSKWPAGIPKPSLSGYIPVSVPKYSTKNPEEARPNFDYYIWQTFIALVWPTKEGGIRGEAQNPKDPDVFKKAPNGTPIVWRQYKEYFELFGTGDKRPAAWDSYDVLGAPCKVETGKNKPVNILNVINQAFSVPLVDQNKNYTYSEVRFNKTQYSFIRGDDKNPGTWLYLKKNLPAPTQLVSMDNGSGMFKGTWRVMTDKDDLSRYYVVDAYTLNPVTNECVKQKMGLVGFHISVKLADFPQWVWATVGQVDNVQRGHGATSSTPISFNNGTDNPKTIGGWANRPKNKVPPMDPNRTPGQITQYNPIPTSTQIMNKKYQQLLKGTVWEYYEVLMTQYPFAPENFKLPANGGIYPKDSGGAYPVAGAVNPAMESYYQSQEDAAGAGAGVGSVGINSCMGCHYGAAYTDYSWILLTGSH